VWQLHRRTEPKIHELRSLGILGFEFSYFDLDFIFCVAIASEDGTQIHELRSLGSLGLEFSYFDLDNIFLCRNCIGGRNRKFTS
jgi:hypothetical protein